MTLRLATPDDHPAERIEAARARVEVLRLAQRVRSEETEQCALAKWLTAQPWLNRLDWWHTPNEAKRPPKSSGSWWARYGGRLKRAGVLSGVSDIIIARPFDVDGVMWCGLIVELKRADGTPSDVSPAQRDFLRRRRETGWAATWARGAIEAQHIIEAIYVRA